MVSSEARTPALSPRRPDCARTPQGRGSPGPSAARNTEAQGERPCGKFGEPGHTPLPGLKPASFKLWGENKLNQKVGSQFSCEAHHLQRKTAPI